jgi:predicted transcriptional regulator of viral defense system
MNYLELRATLKDFTIFSLADVRKIAPNIHRRRLYEWQKKGYLKKIIKGYYIFADQPTSENILFEIANRLHIPSYISFETALAYHNLIPESVLATTSASTRRTYHFQTVLGEFIYHSLKPELFTGYNLVKSQGKCFKIASPEKALLDYLYLNPNIKSRADFASLRIEANKLDWKKINKLLPLFKQKTLTKRLALFMRGKNLD